MGALPRELLAHPKISITFVLLPTLPKVHKSRSAQMGTCSRLEGELLRRGNFFPRQVSLSNDDKNTWPVSAKPTTMISISITQDEMPPSHHGEAILRGWNMEPIELKSLTANCLPQSPSISKDADFQSIADSLHALFL